MQTSIARIWPPRSAGDLRDKVVFIAVTDGGRNSQGGRRRGRETRADVWARLDYIQLDDAEDPGGRTHLVRARAVFRIEETDHVQRARTAEIDGASWRVSSAPAPLGSDPRGRRWASVMLTKEDQG